MSEARVPSATNIGGLKIRRVPLESLHIDPANVRAHDERNLDAIAASLKRFGQAMGERGFLKEQDGRTRRQMYQGVGLLGS